MESSDIKFEYGNCGYHRWEIAFVLDKPSSIGGMVVQKVQYIKWDIINCKTGEKYDKPKNFFEVFDVKPNSKISMKDEWGYDDQKCTKGEIIIYGEAIFYEGYTYTKYLPDDFRVDPDFPQNHKYPISKNRIFFPQGKDSNKVERTLRVWWNCCK